MKENRDSGPSVNLRDYLIETGGKFELRLPRKVYMQLHDGDLQGLVAALAYSLADTTERDSVELSVHLIDEDPDKGSLA